MTATTPLSRSGLTDAEVEESRRLFGDNALKKEKKVGFWRRFLENLSDPVIRILLCALAINLITVFRNADWFETVGVALSVFLACSISALSQVGSDAAFSRLAAEGENAVFRVLRNGKEVLLSADSLVRGDAVRVSAGDILPADGILLEGFLSVDQATLTGESREIRKSPDQTSPQTGGNYPTRRPDAPDSLFRGCTVREGEGLMAVEKVGMQTSLGQISRDIQTEPLPSPLQTRLGKLARQISVFGYLAAALIVAVYLFRAFVAESGFDPALIALKLTDKAYLLDKLFHALTLGLTVVVMAVPEGLPTMVAVVLSANVGKMARDRVLVRKSAGIEAAGSMNLLFTDKTGTLTEGKPSLTAFLLGENAALCPPQNLFSLPPFERDRLAASIALNTSARLLTEKGKPKIAGGNQTERSLFAFLLREGKKAGFSPASLPYRVERTLPFDSSRKFSAAEITGNGQRFTLIKGAPELLLGRIGTVSVGEGRLPIRRDVWQRAIDEKMREGGRLLAFAVTDASVDDLLRGQFGTATLLGVALLEDRVRREAPRAVAALRRAGIHVVMITGDSAPTGEAVARRCGILAEDTNLLLTSEELATLSDRALREILPRLAVVARALPGDKRRLVRVAQEEGLVAGMTGDGLNDAPALKLADVGFAMGDGAPVAREAGDILLLDNNLASVVNAVLYGRTIFKSIRKFIALQMTMNIAAVGVSMLGPFIGYDTPVTVVQMLWINLIMDTLGGLAFAGEAPETRYLHEKPLSRREPILNRATVFSIAFRGIFTVLLCLGFLVLPSFVSRFRPSEGSSVLLTAFFALFIFCSVFLCFCCRTDRLFLGSGLRKNKTFLFIMVAILVIQIGFTYFGGAVLRTVPLSASELRFTFLTSLLIFPADLICRLVQKCIPKSLSAHSRGKKVGFSRK